MQCRIGYTEYAEEKSISIKGIYKQYLFKTDTFEERIAVERYDFTLNEQLSTSLDLKVSILDYTGNINGKPVIEILGRISIEPIFLKF